MVPFCKMKKFEKVVAVLVGYVVAVGAVIFLWRAPLMLALMLIGISGMLLFFLRKKKFYVIYLFTAIWGPLTEAVAIGRGVWHYTTQDFLGIPLWLPFLWGMASLVIAYTYEFFLEYQNTKA